MEGANELHRVDALPVEVAGIEVEPKLLAAADRLERPLGRDRVERDFRRVHLERKPHAALREHVEDRVPAIGELLEPGTEHRFGHGREGIEEMPDARAGEPVDHRHAELLGGAGGALHLLGGPFVHAGRIAVAPHVRWQDRLVPFVDAVADGLAHEVVGNGMHGKVMPLEGVALGGAVAALFEGTRHVEVVAPAGEFEAAVAKLTGLAGQVFQWHVGPLTGEQGDGTRHGGLLHEQSEQSDGERKVTGG